MRIPEDCIWIHSFLDPQELMIESSSVVQFRCFCSTEVRVHVVEIGSEISVWLGSCKGVVEAINEISDGGIERRLAVRGISIVLNYC